MALSKLPLMANATDALVDAVVRADVDTAAIGAVKWDLASLKGRMSNGSDPLDMLQADTHTAGVLAFLATRLGDGDVALSGTAATAWPSWPRCLCGSHCAISPRLSTLHKTL